jgi:putative transposase
LHHVIANGIEVRPIFKNDHDREDFTKRLVFIIEEIETKCLAWALIPNHLLLISGTAPVAKVMLRLLTGYAVSHNLRHYRLGNLFLSEA